MSDIKLFQTVNGGDINVTNGVIERSSGLETAAYLAMFGGNEDGSDWWGNDQETSDRQYISKTQTLLRSIPLTSGNLLLLEEAALSDLSFFIDLKIASLLEVVVTIPKLNTVNIAIRIVAEGVESEFNFTENWKASIVDEIQGGGTAPPIPSPPTYSEYILSLNPIAYWRLNDLDTTTEVVDSISGNNGSRVGTITFGVPGLIPGEPDTALSLPGPNTNRIDLPDIAALRPTMGITIEVLIKQVGGVSQNTLSNWNGYSSVGAGYGITIFPNTAVRFYLATVGSNNGDQNNNGWYEVLNVLTTTGTHLITCTHDGVNRKVYVDGLPVGTNPKAGLIKYGNPSLSPEVPYIGAHRINGGLSGGGINGVIQHVALWDRAKTDAEILATQGFR